MSVKVAVSPSVHRLVYRSAALLLHRLPLPTGKLADSVSSRRTAGARWVSWARTAAAATRRIWIHAPSVGETMAALPVIQRLRTTHPGVQCALTYTSPSVAGWSFDGIDHADYLPLDEPRHVEPVLDALQPDALVFSRGDLWPELVRAASARKIPVAVTGGVISSRSGRLRWPARAVLRDAAHRIDYLGSVSLADAGRWRRLGARPEVLRVSGDPRHDYVLERPVDATAARTLRSWAGTDPVLVAGSVEPADVEPLVGAISRLRAESDARVVLVPHNPTSSVTAQIERRLGRAGLAYGRWDSAEVDLPATRLAVAGWVGGLFDLYLGADVAFVGGGYGRGRPHAAIEPAAFALPVATGPGGRSDADAATLIACGGAEAPDDGSPEALAAVLCRWLRDVPARRAAGTAARRTLTGGAASTDADEIGKLMQGVRGEL